MADEKPADDVQAPVTDASVDDPILKDFLEEDETPKAAPSTAEEKPVKAEGAKEDVKADDTATPPDVPTKTDTADKADEADVDETVEDKPQGKAEERKTQLNTEIRDLVAKRNALKDEVEKANSEVYQPATEAELEADGMNATEAKIEALRQQVEMRDYNAKVADAQLTIESESQRVLQDFPTFNPDSAEYDKELADEAAQLLQANLVTDPNTGQIIGSNVSPYQLYKTLARASGISAAKGQIKAQQATEKQLANVDAPSSAAPTSKPKDELLEYFSDPDKL